MTIFDLLRSRFEPGVIYDGSDVSVVRHLRDSMYSMPEGTAPAAIAIPKSVEQLSAVMRLCEENGYAVTPQGGLTGLVGGSVPQPGGVALSL